MIALLPSTLSEDERAMVDLCRRSDGPARSTATEPESLDPDAGRAVLRAAAAHAVRGLCMVEMSRREKLRGWPEEAALDFGRELRKLRREATLWDLERDRVLGRMARRGVRPIVLKGAALRPLVYAESVERIIGDLDLLVGPDAFDEALLALGEAGYASAEAPDVRSAMRDIHFHDRLEGPGGFTVELHWDLQPPRAPYALAADAWLARSVQTSDGDRRIRTLCPEDMLLHIVSQCLEDRFARLRRIVDVDRIAATYSDLDWDVVVSRAREAGLGHMTALALDLSRALLESPVPERAVARLRPPRHVVEGLRLMSTAPIGIHAARDRWAAAGDALYLTLIDRGRTRCRHALQLSTGRLTPLDWLAETRRPSRRPALVSGVLRALKLFAFVVVACASGAIMRFTPTGRVRWHASTRALPSEREAR